MISSVLSLMLLLLFAELASANFKRLAPVLEAWDHVKRGQAATTSTSIIFKDGWEKLAALVWAIGISIPLLTFTLACHFFLPDRNMAGNFVLGSMIGSNIIGLSVAFALVLLSGRITFFRVRSVSSPVFLLLATVAFTLVCLNKSISSLEGAALFLLIVAYVFYFRRFSSEWKYFERTFSGQSSLMESTEGFLPILAIICMGVGFFMLSVLVAFPFVQELGSLMQVRGGDAFRLGVHYVSFALSIPWLVRGLLSVNESDTAKAVTLTSISHACLLNVLFLPAMASFLGAHDLASGMISYHLPVLLLLTGIFVSTLLIEKESGGKLTWFLILFYLVYSGLSFVR